MSILEIIGTALGVLGVWLMIRQNVWGWPVGLVQVTVSAWVFYGARLYSDAILQVFFFVIQAYGWWHWLTGGPTSEGSLPVTRMRVRAVIGWSVSGVLCALAWGETMRRTTDAALPHWDAFILVFSLLAQWWQARKRLECWVGWMVVNVVAVAVYWAKDLHLYAGLYGIFFAMAVAGHVAWQKSMTAQSTAGGLPLPANPASRTPSVR